MDKITEAFVSFAKIIPPIQNSPSALVAVLSLASLFVGISAAIIFKKRIVISAIILSLFGLFAMSLMAYAVYITTSKSVAIDENFEKEIRSFPNHLNKDEFQDLLRGVINKDLALVDHSTPERAIFFTRKWIEMKAKYDDLADNWVPKSKFSCLQLYTDIDNFNEYVKKTNANTQESNQYKTYTPIISPYNPLFSKAICNNLK